MRWSTVSLSAVALVASVSGQHDLETFHYCDELGRCFNGYSMEQADVTFGIAIPDTDAEQFDVILQTTAAIDSTGWVGLAWGGGMTYNPLAVMWQNGDEVMIASRMAYGYFPPPPFANTTYTLLPGSGVNETHWTLTALCTGCSYWNPFGLGAEMLDPTAENYFAYGFSSVPVDAPDNLETMMGIHQYVGHWYQDLADSRVAEFDAWAAAAVVAAPENAGVDGESPGDELTTTASLTSSTAPEAIGSGGEAEGGAAVERRQSLPSSCSAAGQPRFSLGTAQGWTVVKLAGGLTLPRGMVVDTNGNLLVIENSKGLTVHTFGADGCISSSKTLINNGALNHGIGLTPDGRTLYVSSLTTAWRYSYNPDSQTVSGGDVVVSGMYNGGHPTRALIIPPATPNLLVMQQGSNANFDMATIMPETGRAIVKVFDMNSVPSGGYNYNSQGWNLGYGLRNEVALAVDGNNMVWGVENSADDLTRTTGNSRVDIHIDNPAEELNFLGDPSRPNNDWYGYPTCFTVGGPYVFTDAQFQVGDQFVLAPNSTFGDADCEAQSVAPRLSLQAHTAPIGATFDETFENMYVTLHGSWNRSPAVGYKVVKIPFRRLANGDYDPVAASNSQWGYQDVMWSQGESSCSSFSCLRPSGIVWDRSHTRMYIASDNYLAGELFMLYQT